jgi:carbon storage regulator
MLILARKPGERLILTTSTGEVIKISVRRKSHGEQIQLGIDAPRSVTVDREEVHLRKLAEGSEEA